MEAITEIRSMTRNRPAADSRRTFRIAQLPSLAGILAGTLAMAAALSWQARGVAAQAEPDPHSVEFYTQRVQPIFEQHCYRCHGGTNHRGHLSIATRAGLLRGGMDGA